MPNEVKAVKVTVFGENQRLGGSPLRHTSICNYTHRLFNFALVHCWANRNYRKKCCNVYRIYCVWIIYPFRSRRKPRLEQPWLELFNARKGIFSVMCSNLRFPGGKVIFSLRDKDPWRTQQPKCIYTISSYKGIVKWRGGGVWSDHYDFAYDCRGFLDTRSTNTMQ